MGGWLALMIELAAHCRAHLHDKAASRRQEKCIPQAGGLTLQLPPACRTVPGPSCEPPAKPKARHMLLSFVVRAVFVVITTVMGIVMPFFRCEPIAGPAGGHFRCCSGAPYCMCSTAACEANPPPRSSAPLCAARSQASSALPRFGKCSCPCCTAAVPCPAMCRVPPC